MTKIQEATTLLTQVMEEWPEVSSNQSMLPRIGEQLAKVKSLLAESSGAVVAPMPLARRFNNANASIEAHARWMESQCDAAWGSSSK